MVQNLEVVELVERDVKQRRSEDYKMINVSGSIPRIQGRFPQQSDSAARIDEFMKPGNTQWYPGQWRETLHIGSHRSLLFLFLLHNRLLLYKSIFVETSGNRQQFGSKVLITMHDNE